MKKRFLLAFSFVALACVSAFAQTTKEEMFATIEKTGSVYYAYPVTESLNTKAPKGYTPFYISHYGRHGSRFLISYDDYDSVYQIFLQAEKNDALTELGKDVLNRMHEICAEAKGTTGELTPLGRLQHRGIAERMYTAFPEVFAHRDSISARSTLVHRCAMSMAAFCDRLKEMNPQLHIYHQMDNRHMSYLINRTPEGQRFSSMRTGEWAEEYRKFKEEHIKTDRLMKALFSKADFVRMKVNPQKFVWALYWVTIDLQNMETKVSLYDIFEKQELFDLWQCFNHQLYSATANNPLGKGAVPSNAKNLVRNIIESADEAIKDDCNIAATLRFGHDSGITPLAALMEINNFAAESPRPEETYKYWCDWQVSPMAANLQIIFFNKKNGTKDDILVKVLYNEREAKVPVKTDMFPFYKWTDFRDFYLNKIK